MRRGFTMIELIFVIVILGILAAVAIPRLAATRDDAEVSTVCSNAATIINDFGSYYTAQGTFSTVQNMTNVATDTPGANFGGTTAVQTHLEAGNANSDCVTIASTANDGNITVTVAATPAICGLVRTACGDINNTYQFGGSTIRR